MLSRRQLRVRVMQALYAFFQQENGDSWVAQKEMLSASQRTYDLYLQLLLLLPEMAHHEEMYIKDAPKKHLSNSNLTLNKLSENVVIKFLSNNFYFIDLIKKRNINWSIDADLIGRIFLSLRMSDLYINYMNDDDVTVAKQVKFCEDFYALQLFTNEVFTHEMEDKSVFWAESFEMISSMVSKTISAFNEEKNSLELMSMYRDSEEDEEFMKKLFQETVKNDKWFTEIISDKTKNWDVERIALMDIILLKMALAEVVSFENIPVKVTINEYLDISKVYSTPKSKVFINGIIDKLVTDLKNENKVQKKGRGLVE